jgi:N-acetylglutamate synthase/N-acetylornithine aminotransferase
VTVAAGGVAVDHDAAAVARHLAGRHLQVGADLGLGAGRAVVLTNDLAPGYITKNMRTS